MIPLQQLAFLVVVTGLAASASAQKHLQLDSGFLQAAQVYELAPQAHKGSFYMTSFSFDRYKVSELTNHWERNGFWALYLKEKNFRRVSMDRRSGYSFQLLDQQAEANASSFKTDTANVAVLFEKTTPEGFVITSKATQNVRLAPEVISVFIQTTKGDRKWQAAIYEAPEKGFATEWKVVVFSDSTSITSKTIDRWHNGKKPFITGTYGLGMSFHRNGEQIAAIQFPGTATPKLWIAKTLDKETAFLTAALLEVLLIVSTDLTGKK